MDTNRRKYDKNIYIETVTFFIYIPYSIFIYFNNIENYENQREKKTKTKTKKEKKKEIKEKLKDFYYISFCVDKINFPADFLIIILS